MKVKWIFVVNAVLDLLAGIALVLVPGLATSYLGLQLGPVGQSLVRLLGCALITLGMLTLMLRNVADSQVVRAVLLSLFTGSLIATLLALVGQLYGLLGGSVASLLEAKIGPMLVGGTPTLVIFIILLLMTVGYGILLFGKKAPARQLKPSKSTA